MKKKIIVSSIIIITFLILNYFAITYLKTGNGYISNKIRHATPQKVKDSLNKINYHFNEKVFIFQNYNQKKIEYDRLNVYVLSILDKIRIFDFKYDTEFVPVGTNYLLKKYSNPLFFEMGPRAYITKDKKNIYIVTGTGVLMYLPIDEINNTEQLNFKKINTNFFNIASSKYKNGYTRFVKNILIFDNKIYISYYKKKHDNCYFNSVVVGDLNLNTISFKEFFDVNECQPYYDDQSQVGGNLYNYKDDLILLTIGDANSYDRQKNDNPQNINSLIGKIVAINTKNGKHKIVSMGHRNSQGLFYDDENNIIMSTDHGPEGGDEVNFHKNQNFNEIKNFGWAISSYGEHYEYEDKWRVEDLYKRAPLYKSHKEYGFQEPIKYYTPSIGITQIIKNNQFDNENSNLNKLYIGSMGWDLSEGDLALHEITLDKDMNYLNEKVISIGDRIRDFIYLDKYNIFVMYLESSASLGILKN